MDDYDYEYEYKQFTKDKVKAITNTITLSQIRKG